MTMHGQNHIKFVNLKFTTC